jgi:hypothetical protein
LYCATQYSTHKATPSYKTQGGRKDIGRKYGQPKPKLTKSFLVGGTTSIRGAVWQTNWQTGRPVRLEMFHHLLHGYLIFNVKGPRLVFVCFSPALIFA